MVNRKNYETGDFYIWLLQQAEALKAKELNNIDWENLASINRSFSPRTG